MRHFDPQSIKPARKPSPTERARRLQGLLDNMEQGVIAWGLDRRCEFVNARTLEVLELTQGDLYPGIDLNLFIQRAVKEREYTATEAKTIYNSIDSGEPFSFIRTTKSHRKIRNYGQPRADGHLIITLKDITQQKRNERALAAAKARAEDAEKQTRPDYP